MSSLLQSEPASARPPMRSLEASAMQMQPFDRTTSSKQRGVNQATSNLSLRRDLTAGGDHLWICGRASRNCQETTEITLRVDRPLLADSPRSAMSAFPWTGSTQRGPRTTTTGW
jgi:hypothetical protein